MKSFELSALMVDTHRNVYEAAASLFDTGTTLNMDNEYDRGVTEMVMRVIGIDSDYKDEVAETISSFTAPVDHRAIARRWIEQNGQNIRIDMRDGIRAEASSSLSYDDVNTIVDLISNANVTVRFT